MRNLLIITQKVDENDDLLGFFVGWLKEFAKKFNKVFVITLAKGDYELPDNVFVYSLGKEKYANSAPPPYGSGNPNALIRIISKFVYLFRFYKILFKFVPKSSGVFCHMSPIFAIASWPAAFIFRKRIILWYLHRSVTLRLKLAEKIAYKIATAAKESLNLKSRKIVELGHGIDIEKFKFERKFDDFSSRPIEILSVGRISKIKDYETLIKTARILKDRGLDFNLKIVGRPIMSYDFDYFEKLKKLIQELKLENFIEFAGFIPYSRITDYYRKSNIFINLAPDGGIDKVVLEAMVSGCIIFTSNQAFRKYIQDYEILFFEHGNSEELAQKVITISEISSDKIREIQQRLFDSVSSHHNFAALIGKISSLYG